jgi:hypothetical protein
VHRLDPTRFVTEAILDISALAGMFASDNTADATPAGDIPDFAALFKTGIDIAQHMALLDVIGYNYTYQKIKGMFT